jgi:hypothetical protein
MRLVGILVAAAAFTLGGCATSQPIYNVSNAPIPAAAKAKTLGEISKEIMVAGARLGWQMHPEGPGRLTGRLALRTHLAVVDIEHDTKSYTIKYRDSSNLDARDGMIHREYNNRVQNLDKAIRSQLGG